MVEVRDIDHLRSTAADFRRLAARHDEAGNHAISKKLADVATGLETEAEESTLKPSPPDQS